MTAEVRWIEGKEATEGFLHAAPDREGSAGAQTEALYAALGEALSERGGSLEHVVHETAFFRDIAADMEAFLDARRRMLRSAGARTYDAGTTWIEQPPCVASHRIEIMARSAIPRTGGATSGRRRLFAGNIHGPRGSAMEEAVGMFEAAESLLAREGMSFRDVVRTWIHLRDMARDYAALNQARRAFFRSRGIATRPASTGIAGAPYSRDHRFALSLYALEGPASRIMSSSTLNEAWSYGSDFSRGLAVDEQAGTVLYVSGTASVDEEGRTAHVGQLGPQVERMLWNVESLLRAQNAGLTDILSAITYVKEPEDGAAVAEMLREHGVVGLPHALVVAEVCRPELLCEIEVVAMGGGCRESEA